MGLVRKRAVDPSTSSRKERRESRLIDRATSMFLRYSNSRMLLSHLRSDSVTTMSNHLSRAGSTMLIMLLKKRDLQASWQQVACHQRYRLKEIWIWIRNMRHSQPMPMEIRWCFVWLRMQTMKTSCPSIALPLNSSLQVKWSSKVPQWEVSFTNLQSHRSR